MNHNEPAALGDVVLHLRQQRGEHRMEHRLNGEAEFTPPARRRSALVHHALIEKVLTR